MLKSSCGAKKTPLNFLTKIVRGPPSPDGVVGLVSYVDALNVGGGGDRPEVTPASVVPTCDRD